MNIGMLWFDNDKKTDLAGKITRAADYYRNKYGQGRKIFQPQFYSLKYHSEKRFVDDELGKGKKSGYTFHLQHGPISSNSECWTWSMSAWPIKYKRTGIRSFYLDQSGVFRGSDMAGAPGTSKMPYIENPRSE